MRLRHPLSLARDLYPQFHHTHTAEGLWLYPAAEDSEVLAKADESLE